MAQIWLACTAFTGMLGSVLASVTIGNEAAWVGIGITLIGLYGSSVWMIAGMKKDIKRTADSIAEIKATCRDRGRTLSEHTEKLIRLETKLKIVAGKGVEL